MPTTPRLTEALVRQLAATAEGFARGRAYYEQGAVRELARRGDELIAAVEGSAYEPYQVRITLDEGGVTATRCTCPAHAQGYGTCKHVVAVLLAYIAAPDQAEERPALDTLLADLSAEQLRRLLVTLGTRRPDLADLIESEVALLPAPAPAETPLSAAPAAPATPQSTAPAPAAPRPRRVPLNPDTYRRQARAVLRSTGRMSGSEAYYAVSGIVEAIRSLAGQSRPFLDAGDGRSALAILEGVTTEYVAGWSELDDSDGELGEFFDELGALWTEAILSADLTPAERQTWAKQLAAWQHEVEDYGIDTGFAAASAAVRQGWDYPPLQRALRGEITERGAWDTGERPDYADELALARLTVLERQGRTQEYLYLAQAEGQMDRYLVMLVRLGRTEEAVSEALLVLGTPEDALAVAQALREQGAPAAAARVAEHGLTLEGGHAPLARWLRDLLSGTGEQERALAAARVVLREAPTLADYLAAETVAGDHWPAVRDEVLAALRATPSYYPVEQIAILLHEERIDEALALVDPAGTHSLVELVIDAAITQRPEWAMNAGRQQAARIINAGKAQYYSAAADWLAKAGVAARAAGREAEWRSEIESLLAQHSRKRNLVPLLENLLRRR